MTVKVMILRSGSAQRSSASNVSQLFNVIISEVLGLAAY